MNAADKLYQQYQRDLRQLQDSCPHEQLTDWVEEWWAPDHSTGRRVRTCTNCNLVLMAQRACARCGKPFLEQELREGDGHQLPLGSRYCGPCFAAKLAHLPESSEHGALGV